jgi:hypothetical protein
LSALRALAAAARVIGAAIFAFALMLGLAGLASYLGLFAYPAITGIAIGVLMVLGIIGALALFNIRGKSATGPSDEEQIRALEANGLLADEDYAATRAFEVEEFEDEGMHFFVELEDGRVLFLSGQYLYDYEPDARAGKPRRFPCSAFTVRRHKVERYAVDLICNGKIIEPEVLAPAFGEEVWTDGAVPGDGEIISGTYEEIKRARLAAARR